MMVELSELQALAYIAQIVGVVGTLTAAFIAVRSYINANKRAEDGRRRELETRQAQLLMQVYSPMCTKEFNKMFIDLLNMTWKDYDDFEEKYGSDNNPDNYAMRKAVDNFLSSVGFLVKNGLVEVEKAYEVLGTGTIAHWSKFRDVFLMQREVYGMRELQSDEEYLHDEMIRIADRQGSYRGSKDSMKPYSYVKK